VAGFLEPTKACTRMAYRNAGRPDGANSAPRRWWAADRCDWGSRRADHIEAFFAAIRNSCSAPGHACCRTAATSYQCGNSCAAPEVMAHKALSCARGPPPMKRTNTTRRYRHGWHCMRQAPRSVPMEEAEVSSCGPVSSVHERFVMTTTSHRVQGLNLVGDRPRERWGRSSRSRDSVECGLSRGAVGTLDAGFMR